MRGRALLAAAGASLGAGCSALAPGDADETLIREVVARDRMVALEAALAAIGDRERVVVRADDHAVENVTGHDSTRRVFDFEGTYVAEANLDP